MTSNGYCRDINVSPDVFEMSSRETLPLAFDIAPLLEEGETASGAAATLVQIDTGQDYAPGHPGGAIVQDALLIQTVTGLQPGKRYRLVIQFTAAPGKVWAPSLLIDCPE